MDIKTGDIVRSLAGRDKDRFFYVISVSDGRVALADGIVRKIDNPKMKKPKHLLFVASPKTRICEKLAAGEKVFDAEIRKSLRQLGFCEDADGYGKAEDDRL